MLPRAIWVFRLLIACQFFKAFEAEFFFLLLSNVFYLLCNTNKDDTQAVTSGTELWSFHHTSDQMSQWCLFIFL